MSLSKDDLVETSVRALRPLLTAALVLAAMQSSDAGFYRISPEPRAFADCNDAADYLAAHPVVAQMRYRLRIKTSPPKLVRLGPERYRADVMLRANIDPRSRVLSMPQWSWRHMSARQQAELRSYTSALQQHEVGHLRIAQQLVAGGVAAVHIFGSDPTSVEDRLRLAVGRYGEELSAQLQHRQQLYDRVTQHGANQIDAASYGFPTGPNVQFRCP